MVRACLRVLKQHGVVALVDMFCYSNRYECTEKAANLFSRECEDKLLFDAVEFVVRRRSFTGNASAEPANLHSTSPLTISQRHDLSLNQRLSCSFPSELTFKEGNAHRLAAGAYSHQELPLASVLKGEDYTEVKTAVAEFFCACNRGIPIGELWIVLVSKRFPPGTSSRVDWKKACRCIDHRRLITFGLVHGLISRVHNFPLLLAGKFSESPAEGDYAPDFQLSHSSLDRTRPMIQQHGKSDHQEERRKLANRAAHMMDGMRCDDDLVCALSLPLHEIFALFPDRRIVSVFATG